jgi:energy-coupling factor transporter ATP-binding protein EcfA2
MMKAVIITENESDCNIAKEYGFNSILLNDFLDSDDSTEKLKVKADIFYLLFNCNDNQSTSEDMLKLAKFMFSNGIEAEIVIHQNSLKDYISQNGQESLTQLLEGGLDFVEYIIDGIKDLSEKQRVRMIREEIYPLLAEVDNLRLEHYLSFMKGKFKLNARWIEALRGTIKAYREEHEKQKVLDNIENPETYEITEAEKEEATKYLKSPDVISKIRDDITKVGIIGENINKVALYLIMLTRKFEAPIHAVLFGFSAAGKSHLVNTVGELVPPEDRFILTSGSSRSLDYLSTDDIKEKVFIVQEIHGLKEIEENIRVMQSEGKLTRICPVYNYKTRRKETVKHEVICQASIITTTTMGGVHPENSTRIFEIHLDESEEQTKRVIELKKDKVAFLEEQEKDEIKHTKRLHHNIQRLLEKVEVVIPFSKHIDFPSSSIQNRRDIERFLNLIKAVAFLRQYQKEKKGKGEVKFIEADIEDYKIAYELAYEMLKSSFSSLTEDERKVLRVIVSLREKGEYADIFLGHFEEEATKLAIQLPQEDRFIEILNKFIKKGFIKQSGYGHEGKAPLYTITLYDVEHYDYLEKISEVSTPKKLNQRIKEAEKGK